MPKTVKPRKPGAGRKKIPLAEIATAVTVYVPAGMIDDLGGIVAARQISSDALVSAANAKGAPQPAPDNFL